MPFSGCAKHNEAGAKSLTTSRPSADVVLPAADLKYDTKPSGVRVAVLYGDPSRKGPFGLRLQYPVGYSKGPHYHPKDAFVTVLRGSYYRGYGTTFDRSKGIHLVAGTFSVNPARVAHYEWVEEPAQLEVHAEGPWGTVHVDGSGQPVPGKGGDACGGDACEGHGPALPPDQSPPVVRKPRDLRWEPRPGGDEVALLFGDPAKPGPFVLRIRSAGGTPKELHLHPRAAVATILSGGFRFGTGNTFVGSKARVLGELDLLRLPAAVPHFRVTDGPTILEVHGTGPWGETWPDR